MLLESAKAKLKKGSLKIEPKEVSALIKEFKTLNKLEKSKFAIFLDEVETSSVQQRALVDADEVFAVKYLTDMWPSVQVYVLEKKPKQKAQMFANTQYFASTHVAVVKAMLADKKMTSRIMGAMISGVDSNKAKLDIVKRFPDCVKFSEEKVELAEDAKQVVLTHDANLAKYLKRFKRTVAPKADIEIELPASKAPAKEAKVSAAPKVKEAAVKVSEIKSPAKPKAAAKPKSPAKAAHQHDDEEDDEPISTPAKESITRNKAAVEEIRSHLSDFKIDVPLKELEVSLERGTTANAAKVIKAALGDDELIAATKKAKVDLLFMVLALTNYESNKFNAEQKKRFAAAHDFAEDAEGEEEEADDLEVEFQNVKEARKPAPAKPKAAAKSKASSKKSARKSDDDEEDDDIAVHTPTRNRIIEIEEDDGSDYDDREWLHRMESSVEIDLPKETAKKLSAEDEKKFVNFVRLAVKRLLEDPSFLREHDKSVTKKELAAQLEDFDKLATLVNSKQVKEFEGLTHAQRCDIYDIAIPVSLVTFTSVSKNLMETYDDLGNKILGIVGRVDRVNKNDDSGLEKLISKCVASCGGKLLKFSLGRFVGDFASMLTLQVRVGNNLSVILAFDLARSTWKFV